MKVKKAQEEKYRRMCQKMTGTYEQVKEVPIVPASSANQNAASKATSQSDSSNQITQLMVVGAVIAAGAAVAFFLLSKK